MHRVTFCADQWLLLGLRIIPLLAAALVTTTPRAKLTLHHLLLFILVVLTVAYGTFLAGLLSAFCKLGFVGSGREAFLFNTDTLNCVHLADDDLFQDIDLVLELLDDVGFVGRGCWIRRGVLVEGKGYMRGINISVNIIRMVE